MVLDEFTGGAIFERYWFFPTPGKFQHGSIRIRDRTGNGTASHHIATVNLAAVTGMVRQLLCHGPVHVFKVGLGNPGLRAVFGSNADFQVDIEGPFSRLP